MYTTRVTKIKNRYGCRVYADGILILESRCDARDQIGPTFRDLLRTLDKLNGDAFTSAARARKFAPGNRGVSVRHIWYR